METAAPEMNAVVNLLPIIFVLIYLFALLISLALTVLVWCKLFGKSGYSWGLGFLMLVPVVNIVIPFYLAFADWPVLKKLRQYEQDAA